MGSFVIFYFYFLIIIKPIANFKIKIQVDGQFNTVDKGKKYKFFILLCKI